MIRMAGAIVVGVALAAGAACSPKEEPRSGPAPAPTPIDVQVASVAARRMGRTIEPVGTVRARTQVVISARMVASVVGVHVSEGQPVKRGDLLVTLDDRDVSARLRSAEAGVREARTAIEETERAISASARALDGARAQRDLAQATLGRYRTLLDRRAVAPQEYDEVTARARAAEAEVARREETHAGLEARRATVNARIEHAQAEAVAAAVPVGFARLTAPLDGVVVAKAVEVGTLAAPGVALLTLEDARYRLEVSVEESDVKAIRVGQSVPVVIDAVGAERRGPVAEIAPAADPASRTVAVKIDLPPDPLLRSGLYGRARFVTGEGMVLSVARSAVVERGQLQGVFVVDAGGVARFRLVKAGRALDGAVEILSGLGEGERVVVDGAERLADGAPVKVR